MVSNAALELALTWALTMDALGIPPSTAANSSLLTHALDRNISMLRFNFSGCNCLLGQFRYISQSIKIVDTVNMVIYKVVILSALGVFLVVH